MSQIKIIAEIGCNHNGDKELARKMVRLAKECGVDGVKFQTFNSTLLISKYAKKAEYQKKTTGEDENQLEMTRKLELSYDDYLELQDYAKSLELEVFSTPFDFESIQFLENNKQTIWKIPSGEITNLPYLERIGNFKIENKLIILSTGMATIQEIQTALDILQKHRKNRIIILHCNTEYPTPDSDVNISAIDDLKRNFPNYEIGYSDHSVGSVAAIMSVTYGVTFIEKHFTLNKNFDGPDHKASATPEELKELVDSVRKAEIMLGNGFKQVTQSEMKNKSIARKSIVAKTNIKSGDIFTENNIICKRPGNGISPMHWYEVLGSVAEKDFNEDELIEMSDINWEGNHE
jgi:N-acetylneuraminate synthase